MKIKNYFDKLCRFFLNYFETLLISLISIVVIILLTVFHGLIQITSIFLSDIHSHYLGFSGGLVGLLLTAYGIFYGLTPSIKENDSDLAEAILPKINAKFSAVIICSIAILVLSLALYFVEFTVLLTVMTMILLYLTSYTILAIVLITIYLTLLFKISN